MHATARPPAQRAPEGRGLVIGRFGGAPIVVRPGWLLATGVLAFVSAPVARAVLPGVSSVGAYLVGFGFGLLLLGSVLVHELAHAWTARRRGIAVQQIVLTLVGGHTEMAGARTPGTSALVAAAGPAANVALAGLGWVGMELTRYVTVVELGNGVAVASTTGGSPALFAAFAVLASSNALVAAFNLLPGLPMDGGWIFEALVWRVTGRRNTGTRVAAVIGRVVAVGLLVVVVVVPLVRSTDPSMTAVIWATVIGVMLWTSAGQFLALADWRDRVEGVDLTGLARPAVATTAKVLGDLPHGAGEAGPEVVLVADRHVLGYVDGAALAEVPVEHRSTTPVSAVLVPLPAGAVVDGTVRGSAALHAVAEVARVSPVMVVLGPDGAVVGLLRYADVMQALRAAGPGRARRAPDAS